MGLHVKYLLFLSDFKDTWIFSSDFFYKSSNIRFHGNPSSWSRLVPCEQTDRQTDEQTDMTKLVVTFRIFANAPKNCTFCLLVFCIVLKTSMISLHGMKWLVFTTKTECVYFAVRSCYLNEIKVIKMLIKSSVNAAAAPLDSTIYMQGYYILYYDQVNAPFHCFNWFSLHSDTFHLFTTLSSRSACYEASKHGVKWKSFETVKYFI
jgi:hypothetical protein